MQRRTVSGLPAAGGDRDALGVNMEELAAGRRLLLRLAIEWRQLSLLGRNNAGSCG
jgi:hypothetical protein